MKSVSDILRKDTNIFVLLGVFTIVVLFLGGMLGGRFFSINNFQSMAFQISEFGFLAIAMSLAMLTGGIDLSIVANAGLSGIMAAFVLSGKFFNIETMNSGVTILIAVFAALLCSTLCGLFNGILISKLSIPPILATLGTMIFYTGIGMALTNGESVRVGVKGFSKFSSKTLFDIPYIFLLLVITFIVVSFILSKTKFGKQIYMVGQNSVALRFSGINSEKVLIKTYGMIGFLVGISSLIIISRVNSARMGFGDTYQLQTILVAVLGGIDPDGGRGNLFGVALGIVVLQFLQSAFTIFQFTPYAKKLIWGVLLLFVMIMNFLIDNGKIFKLSKKIKNN
ncbi:ABC transporter permease [Tissierella praeacuta]|uniref:ABC transporter permease n=1 Tax=Tissierella praeacuta TaxID=43131 RepID=UPI0033401322